MSVPLSVRPYWDEFARSIGHDPADRFYEAFHFDDNERSANALARLVLAGIKRATAGLAWENEVTGKPLPKAGDLSVVTDWAGTPLCVIETRHVEIVPYGEVTEEFAGIEGEGDGSLQYWRDAHWAYFGRVCARIGRTAGPDMPVVCERFEVIYRAGVA